MPWTTPTLRQVRETVRGEITTALGRASFVANSVLRVIADATAALAHLTLKYIDWLSLQLLPDTAETEWLDRHGDIWLVNADGSKGRKVATPARGQVTFTGTPLILVPAATQLTDGVTLFATDELITIDVIPTPVSVTALTPGAAGNLDPGTQLQLVTAIAGVDGFATVVELDSGTDAETDDELRARILRRIQQPPMGGDKDDYEQWALQVPGVTRAWCAPQEMGVGTVTVRFLMDDLRADNDGWPTQDDVNTVQAYIDSKRPVTVEDCWVLAPIKQPVDWTLTNLNLDTPDVRANIEQSIRDMLFNVAAPGQTIFAAWKSYAVMNAQGVASFELVNDSDDVMPSPGHMAVLGSIIFDA